MKPGVRFSENSTDACLEILGRAETCRGSGVFAECVRAFDGIELDNIYVSEIFRNEIWVLSPDGAQRLLVANKLNAPLDNNTSLVMMGDILCTANLGFLHAKPEEAARTVVCMKGFTLPK